MQYPIQRGDLLGLNVGAGERYIGSFDGDDALAIQMPGYKLTDLSLQYDFSRFVDS